MQFSGCAKRPLCLERNISAAFMECVVKSIFSLLQIFPPTPGAVENASAVGMPAFDIFLVYCTGLFYYISISKDSDVLEPREKLSVESKAQQ
jgi:hypothetical protein